MPSTQWLAAMAKSLRPPPPDPELPDEASGDPASEVAAQLQRMKWFCWHGNVFRALQTPGDLLFNLDAEHGPAERAKLLKAVHEFDSYLRANAGRIPNYGECRRAGEAISTAFTESTVNQGPPATADPHPRAQRPARRRLPPLVPQLQTSTRPRGARCVASPNLSRSPSTAPPALAAAVHRGSHGPRL